MLTKLDIQILINECRNTGENGLGNGNRATIQELTVDFLSPPADFLGVGSNPAIFVNSSTYKLLGRFHETWTVNKTIAVKESFLQTEAVKVIGVIVHEAGHAFNVAANIINSEANAYIFEIEVLTIWFKTKSPLLLSCSRSDLQSYFESRLPYYQMDLKPGGYLAKLVSEIESNTILGHLEAPPKAMGDPKFSRPHRFVIQTPRLVDPNPTAFFKDKPWHLRTASFCEENSDALPGEEWQG